MARLESHRVGCHRTRVIDLKGTLHADARSVHFGVNALQSGTLFANRRTAKVCAKGRDQNPESRCHPGLKRSTMKHRFDALS
jgi:hypothetical protein